MRSMTATHTLHTLAAALLLTASAAQADSVATVNGSMPNRISMNVSVPKQTQRTTFGEKVNAGLHAAGRSAAAGTSTIVIECGRAACAVIFPDGSGTRADLAALSFSPLPSQRASQLRKASAGASLLGGPLPGGGIVSAALTAVAPVAKGEGAAAANARMSEGAAVATRTRAPGVIDAVDTLPDGNYVLTVVVERATPGLKDVVKTQVRAVQPPRVRIDVGFNVEAGVPTARNDVAKNSIRNIR
jgi:hypothetical protein